MPFARARLFYLLLTVLTIGLGLESRAYRSALPDFVGAYAGDTLWALMVYLGLGILWPQASVGRRAGLALGFSVAIELSQLYHAPWIDAVRRTRLGGLVLGFGFLWSDLVCYAAGIGFGAGVESLLQRKSRAAHG